MNDETSGSKLPTSVGSGVAVELVGGLVLVPLFDCASAPTTVKDRLATSKSRNRLFLKVNKFCLAKTNTHNLYGSY